MVLYYQSTAGGDILISRQFTGRGFSEEQTEAVEADLTAKFEGPKQNGAILHDPTMKKVNSSS